jgi:uncharacterized membrane protein
MASETGRIEAYSDGVFSIAATLLVLELKPPAAGQPFWQGILHQWPGYVSFVLSFLLIGIIWINHHRLFSHIHRSDEFLLSTNLLLLLGVVWLPYPTSLMAQAVGTPQLRDAAIFYNASYLALSLFFNLLLFVCLRRRLADCGGGGARAISKYYMAGPLMCAMCLLASFWSVALSLTINLVVALYFLLSPGATAMKFTASAR